MSESAPFTESVDACELAGKTFPPPKWIIPNIIPEGATLLAAAEKIGKSWWALQIARAVAHQGGNVAYLALEDTQKSLHWRMGKQPGPWPSRLRLVPQGGISGGAKGIQALDKWAKAVPNPRLMIVDTFEKFRGEDEGGRQYRSDYKAGAALKALADKHGVSLVFLHHLNQNEERGGDDPRDLVYRVSGTSGLTGAVDTILILRRPRLMTDAMIFATGRMVEERDEPLQWNPGQFLWSMTVPDGPAFGPDIVGYLETVGVPLSLSTLVEIAEGFALQDVTSAIKDAVRAGRVVQDGNMVRLAPSNVVPLRG